MPIDRKYERDVDLLLAEEFATSSVFADKFKRLTKFADIAGYVADFSVSKSDVWGEADLIVLYEGESGSRFALLIEDKVDANLQPEQANRYRQRAETAVASGAYSDFEVILCAPQYYITNRSDLDGFDRTISLEQVADIIEQSSDKRGAYRAAFLRTAADIRQINTWKRVDDPITNAFWDAAVNLAVREFSILEMRPLKLTKGSVWIIVRPQDFPTLPKMVYVALKGGHGNVDLTFDKTTAHRFHGAIHHLLEPAMTVHQTGAAAAIRLKAPPFSVTGNFATAEPTVRAYFDAASVLVRFYRRFRNELDMAAAAATSTSA